MPLSVCLVILHFFYVWGTIYVYKFFEEGIEMFRGVSWTKQIFIQGSAAARCCVPKEFCKTFSSSVGCSVQNQRFFTPPMSPTCNDVQCNYPVCEQTLDIYIYRLISPSVCRYRTMWPRSLLSLLYDSCFADVILCFIDGTLSVANIFYRVIQEQKEHSLVIQPFLFARFEPRSQCLRCRRLDSPQTVLWLFLRLLHFLWGCYLFLRNLCAFVSKILHIHLLQFFSLWIINFSLKA